MLPLENRKTMFAKLPMCYQDGPVACTAVGCLQLLVKVTSLDKALTHVKPVKIELNWSSKLRDNYERK